MITPKMMEAWVTLMAEAMRGSSDAQDAMRLLTLNDTTQDNLMRWTSRFMPTAMTATAPAQSAVFGEWLEQWWKTMGVVPRYRYVELLERNEELRQRLDDCEKLQRRMTGMTGLNPLAAASSEETEKVVSLWGSMIDDTLKMQSEWLRTMMPSAGSDHTAHTEKPASTADTGTTPSESD
jgi:hypothetical protein